MVYTVKQARQLAGKTQVEMAQELAVSLPTYRRYETNPATINIGRAKRIAEITGFSTDDIDFFERP